MQPEHKTLDYYSPKRVGWLRARWTVLLQIIRSRRTKRLALAVSCIVVTLVPLGYLSNWLSLKTCERQTVEWLVVYRGMDQEIHHAPDSAQEIFRAAGVRVLPMGPEGHSYPIANVDHAHIVLPFIVTVDYDSVGAPLAGDGRTRRFLCLFGYVVVIDDYMRWIA